MEAVTITKQRFLEWYFESGQDSENLAIRESISEQVISSLFKDGVSTITVESIFDQCNTAAIRVSYLEEFDDSEENYDKELSDIQETINIKLV